MELIGKIPPNNVDAERAVLGAMMLDKNSVEVATGILKQDDFYFPANEKIFIAIKDLFSRNSPIDLLTVKEELNRKKILDAINGVSYLAEITTSTVSISNTEHYCNLIKEKSILRKLISTCSGILEKAYSNDAKPNSIIEIVEKDIFDINSDSDKKGLEPIKDALLEAFADMENKMQNIGELTGISTGFADLDRKLSGLQKSDLILIAARPSMGKTALMVNIATNAALNTKKPASVAVFSLEMSRNQLIQRMLSSISNVDLQKIVSGNLNEEDYLKILAKVTEISKANIEIDDTAGISPVELKAKCRRMKREVGLDLIVIDYLQLMQMQGKIESRLQEISSISRSLKAIAKELEVPVIALSQLSRMPEQRSDHRPMLSDLRESGAIEQDSDIVMFLFRDEYYTKEKSEKPNIGEVIIAKHRNGPTGTVELLFKKEYTKFLNLDRTEEM